MQRLDLALWRNGQFQPRVCGLFWIPAATVLSTAFVSPLFPDVAAFRLNVQLVLWTTLFCSISDLLYGKIYNGVTYSVLILSLLLQLLTIPSAILKESLGVPPLGAAITGLGIGFALGIVPYLFAQGGAGDAKLCSVLGIALGGYEIVSVWFYSMTAACAFVCLFALSRLGAFRFLRAVYRRVSGFLLFCPLPTRTRLLLSRFAFRENTNEELSVLKKRYPIAPGFFVGLIYYLVFG